MAIRDITGLHHIGLVVRDMKTALDTFQRLGFRVGPPTYPALPPAPGAAPEPIGAGNTHADFPRSFIEILGFAPEQREHTPAGAELIPLQIPDDQLAATRAAMTRTVAGLAARLDRYEGAHILVFTTDDAEQTVARLDRAGVGHGGAHAAQRPITTADGTRLEAIKYLEINGDEPTGMPAEGRVGAAQDAPAHVLDAQVGLDHPNGAVGLAECVLCVGDDELDATADRYERCLGIAPEHDGPSRGFGFASSRLTLTTASGLADRLPGEQPPSAPALCAYTIAVTDLAAAERLLHSHGVETGRAATGEPFEIGRAHV